MADMGDMGDMADIEDLEVMEAPQMDENAIPRHPTYFASYATRAAIPFTPSLTAHLLMLMSVKKTNLCLSADVQYTSQLLDIAEECGDYICMLKTHADIISDFSEKTVHGLTDIAQRKKFLLFEDRKFGDIGNTVQMQYAAGPHKIANWASIVNAHVFPGPAIITALKSAAHSAIVSSNSSIFTEITGGGDPDSLGNDASAGRSTFYDDGDGEIEIDSPSTAHADSDDEKSAFDKSRRSLGARKSSVVSISTTISSSAEYISPPPGSPIFNSGMMSPGITALQTPLSRGLLLLAQMSSEDNLLTPEYTQQCLDMARRHRDFVLGFIAQEALNKANDDNFLVLTPGVSLPPSDEPAPPGSKRSSLDGRGRSGFSKPPPRSSYVPPSNGIKLGAKGDGLGQQYNDPHHVIFDKGCDIIIVGRAIINADDRAWEAERHRQAGWAAYLERTGNVKSSRVLDSSKSRSRPQSLNLG